MPGSHFPASMHKHLKGKAKGKESDSKGGKENTHTCRAEKLLDMNDFRAFAEWAFSDKGFRELKILAIGDFTSDEHKWSQVALHRCPRGLCRRSGAKHYNFRVMGPRDEYLWDEIDKSREVLKACAVDGVHPENVLDEDLEMGDSEVLWNSDVDPDGISD